MNGLMMDYPLTLQHFLERGGRLFPNKEIATRLARGMHRYRYCDYYRRTHKLAHTLKQQFPTKIFFGDEEASADELIDGLGLTVPEYKAVTQILPRMQHAFLIKRPGASVICRNDLSKALAHAA